MFSCFRSWKIGRILRRPVSANTRRWLRRYVRPYLAMPPPEQRRLEQITTVMLERLHWEGCDGLAIDDQMRTCVAGNAAMMLLGSNDYYFDSVSAILLFPGIIRRDDPDSIGPTLGEAWPNGGVVLAWPEASRCGQLTDGRNVVVHEFAHHLDGRDGEMGGDLPFVSDQDQRDWNRVAAAEYQRLVAQVSRRRATFLDPYGATNRAEFFAVCSEVFFELPRDLQHYHPQLFELLRRFYAVDPRRWYPDDRDRGENRPSDQAIARDLDG